MGPCTPDSTVSGPSPACISLLSAFSFLLPFLVHSRLRLPSSYRHRHVIDPRLASATISQSVFEEGQVVSLWIVSPGVCASGFPAWDRGVCYGLGSVQHESQLECRDQVGVEDSVLVLDGDILSPFLQVRYDLAGLYETVLVAVDSDVLLHRFLHLDAEGGDSLASLMLEDVVVDSRFFLRGHYRYRVAV